MPLLDPSNAGSYFPMNAVEVIVAALRSQVGPSTQGTDDGVRVFPRPLDETAQTQSIGVYPDIRTPDEDSREIGGIEPTIHRYSIPIETHVADADRAAGIAVHGMLTALVDHVLYRHDPLVGALQQLTSTSLGVTTSYYRHGVGTQQYLTGVNGRTTVFRSMTEFWLETQTN